MRIVQQYEAQFLGSYRNIDACGNRSLNFVENKPSMEASYTLALFLEVEL